MPWAGGVYTRGYPSWSNDAASNLPISATKFDTEDNDFAAGLNNCLTKDGLNIPNAAITWGLASAQVLALTRGNDGTVFSIARTGGANNPGLQEQVTDATGVTLNLTTAQTLALAIQGTNAISIASTRAITVPAPSSGIALTVNGVAGSDGIRVVGDTTNIMYRNTAATAVFSINTVKGWTGAGVNVTDAALGAAGVLNFYAGNSATVSLSIGTDGGATIGAPTGGDKGIGTLNAVNLYVNGAAVTTALGANPTALVGLVAVNGSANTFLRSDGAPALDVTISPTWTGNHVYNPTSGTPLLVKLSGTSLFSVNGTSAPTLQGYGPVAAALVDLTPDKSSFTGTFKDTTAAGTTGTVNWSRVGNQITLMFPTATFTSQNTDFFMTGLPAGLRPARNQFVAATAMGFEDNGAVQSNLSIDANVQTSGTINFAKAASINGWVGSGTKGIANACAISFSLA